jgi:hypothetical protein
MPTTIAYSNKGGYWKTKYTWFASFMEKVGRKFFTSSIDGASTSGGYPSKLVWKHNVDDDTKRTNYYDQVGGSGVSVSFNDRVSSNKIYKSISLEGTSNIQDESFNTFVVNADNNPAKQFSMGRIKDKGGILYGHIGLSNYLLDGSNIKAIGTISKTNYPVAVGGVNTLISSVGSFNLTQTVSSVLNKSKYILMNGNGDFFNMAGAQITFNSDASYLNDDFLEPFNLNIYEFNPLLRFLPVEGAEGYSPAFNDFEQYLAVQQDGPATLLEITPQEINGAPPRGQYAQADIVLGSQPYELYSINVNYEPTDLDHSK